MTDAIALLGIAIIGGWFRYNLNMSASTAKISQVLAGDTIEAGLQDAITPPLLALGYYACVVSGLLTYFALGVYGDWNAFVLIFAFWLGGVCAPDKFVPDADAPYWVRIVHSSLCERSERYARRGNEGRVTTLKELARRLEQAFPNLLQSAETPATK